MRELPYRVTVGDLSGLVLTTEDGRFLELGSQRFEIDLPSDLLALTPAGAEAVADFGAFQLAVRRSADGRGEYQGRVGAVAGDWLKDEERALWSLLEQLGDAHAPRRCFFCRYSDVEPSTGWGNLGCMVGDVEAYERVLATASPQRIKWITSTVPTVWVDEWDHCERFTTRPRRFGYRGRT